MVEPDVHVWQSQGDSAEEKKARDAPDAHISWGECPCIVASPGHLRGYIILDNSVVTGRSSWRPSVSGSFFVRLRHSEYEVSEGGAEYAIGLGDILCRLVFWFHARILFPDETYEKE